MNRGSSPVTRRKRFLGFGFLGLFVIGAVVLAVSLYATRDTAWSEARAYGASILPLRKEGGSIIATGLRPRIADLELGRVLPEQFRNEAAGWRIGIARVRSRLAEIAAPEHLGKAASGIDRALMRYLETIDAFVQASYAVPGSALREAIATASGIGRDADRIYDEAVRILDRAHAGEERSMRDHELEAVRA